SGRSRAVVVPHVTYAQHGGRSRPIDAPLHTVAASTKDQNQVCMTALAPHVTRFNTGATGQEVDKPLPTVTANSFVKRPGGALPLGLVAGFLAKYHGDEAPGGRGADPREPARTLDTANRQAVVAAFLAQHNT